MSNEEILKAVNYLKTLEPTKDVIINFMELARKDERDTVIGEIEKWFKQEVFAKMRNSIPTAEIFTKLNELRKEGIV